MEDTLVVVKVLASVPEDTEVQGRLSMRVRKDEPTDTYLGFMPALKLYAQGRTTQQAHRFMEQTVKLYLETAIREGQLADILLTRGFRRLVAGEKPSELTDLLLITPLSAQQTPDRREMELEFAGANAGAH